MLTDVLIADFVVTSVEERDFKLDRALAAAKIKASIDRKRGVLLTRHDFRRFSVSLTPHVPFGTIREWDCARVTN